MKRIPPFSVFIIPIDQNNTTSVTFVIGHWYLRSYKSSKDFSSRSFSSPLLSLLLLLLLLCHNSKFYDQSIFIVVLGVFVDVFFLARKHVQKHVHVRKSARKSVPKSVHKSVRKSVRKHAYKFGVFRGGIKLNQIKIITPQYLDLVYLNKI